MPTQSVKLNMLNNIKVSNTEYITAILFVLFLIYLFHFLHGRIK